jgi:uncharacterized membrane protein
MINQKEKLERKIKNKKWNVEEEESYKKVGVSNMNKRRPIMANFLLHFVVYMIVLLPIGSLVMGSSTWLKLLAFLIAIFVAEMILRLIKKIWNPSENK